MATENLTEKAILIAVTAHSGQLDLVGAPYILHPLRVMGRFDDEEHRIVAVLHDVVEDTVVTIEELRQVFCNDIVDAIDAISDRGYPKDRIHRDYIARCAKNLLARDVKIEDIRDNTRIERIAGLTELHAQSLGKRYTRDMHYLVNFNPEQEGES